MYILLRVVALFNTVGIVCYSSLHSYLCMESTQAYVHSFKSILHSFKTLLFQNLQEDIVVSQNSPISKRCAEERDYLEPKSKRNRLSLKRKKDKKRNCTNWSR